MLTTEDIKALNHRLNTVIFATTAIESANRPYTVNELIEYVAMIGDYSDIETIRHIESILDCHYTARYVGNGIFAPSNSDASFLKTIGFIPQAIHSDDMPINSHEFSFFKTARVNGKRVPISGARFINGDMWIKTSTESSIFYLVS